MSRSWIWKVFLAGFVLLLLLCDCFLTAQDPRRPKHKRIQVEPQMSNPIELEYGGSLMLWLIDDSVLVIGGMPDPLLPHTRAHLVIWSLSSLKSFNEVGRNNGQASFGTPNSLPKNASFKSTMLEASADSVEAVSNDFDLSIRTSLVDRKSGLLRVQRDRVKGFAVVVLGGLLRDLTEKDFQSLP